MCMREGASERERERERELIIFRDNGSDVMIYDVEEFIRIGAFSWPTAISHRRIKKKTIVNKRKSKRTSNLIKCYIHIDRYVTERDRERDREREGYEHGRPKLLCTL